MDHLRTRQAIAQWWWRSLLFSPERPVGPPEAYRVGVVATTGDHPLLENLVPARDREAAHSETRGETPGFSTRRRTTRTAWTNEAVRVLVDLARRLMDQAPHGVMRQHQAVHLLQHQVWCLAAQDRAGAQDVGLDFIVGGLHLPAFLIQRGNVGGWCGSRVEQGGSQAVRTVTETTLPRSRARAQESRAWGVTPVVKVVSITVLKDVARVVEPVLDDPDGAFSSTAPTVLATASAARSGRNRRRSVPSNRQAQVCLHALEQVGAGANRPPPERETAVAPGSPSTNMLVDNEGSNASTCASSDSSYAPARHANAARVPTSTSAVRRS